jgi:hypothetical protein
MAIKKRAVSSVASGARAKGRKAAARPGPEAHRRPEEVERWIQAEVRAQERIYRRIVRDMNALNDRRMKWVKEFYQRLQTRGFSVHAGIRRKVKPEEIPPIPKRIRVVF